MRSVVFPNFLIVLFIAALILPHSGFAQERQVQFPMNTVWEFTAPEREITGYQNAISADPIISGPYLIAASTNGVLYCLDKRLGSQIWRIETGAPIVNSFHVNESEVYFSSANQLFAADRDTGAILKYQSRNKPIASEIAGRSSHIYFYTDGTFFALETGTLKKSWQFKIDDDAEFTSGIYLSDGRAYAGDSLGRVYAFDAESGSLLWRTDGEEAVRSGFIVVDDRIFHGTDNNHIIARNTATGTIIWKQRVSGDVRSGLATDGNHIYFYSRDRFLRVYDAGHGGPSRFAPFNLSTSHNRTPLIVENKLIYANNNEFVGRQIDQNFMTIGSHKATGSISTSLVVDPDYKALYCGTETGRIQAAIWQELELDLDLPLLAGSSRRSTREMLMDREEFDISTLEGPSTEESREAEKVEDNESGRPEDPQEAEPAEKQQDTRQENSTSKTEPEASDSPESSPEEDIEPLQNTELSAEEENADTGSKPESFEGEEVYTVSSESPPILDPDIKESILSGGFTRAAELSTRKYADSAESTFTISIGLFCRAESLLRLNDIFAEHDILLFQQKYQDQDCYFFCVGTFPGREQAETYMRNLDAEASVLSGARVYRLDSFIQP